MPARPTRLSIALLALAAFGALAVATPARAQAQTSKLATLTKDMKKSDGLLTLYHSDQKLYALLKPTQLNQEFLVLSSIARGVSAGRVLGGMTWGDQLWSFRKVGKNIHVLQKNTRFRAKAGTPEANAVKLAYSDSVLYALPILTSEGGGDLVDMTKIFFSDDEGVGRSLGARIAADRTTWAKVAAYPKNVELQVAAVYVGSRSLETADSRGMQVNVHYSISALPTNNGYKPRVADDRVGYFMTVAKDFSDITDDEQFVRYINRWDLQKAAPKAELSPPKEPIIFYLEKTVPLELRPTIREAILEWNKAYEKIGFANAIEVRQQRDDDTWDPEDVRYNTFRWITAEAGFAMGPSRVNPRTGQILDADIIFDASFLRYWKTDFETFTPESTAALFGAPNPDADGHDELQPLRNRAGLPYAACTYGHGMQQQMGFAAAALTASGLANQATGELPRAFVHQALKEVAMHEVGHTLGLRHNFKASSWKSLKDIDGIKPESGEPTVASVMDYVPANILAKDQGRYYTDTIGPYDYWAIEYGYKPLSKEAEELPKIAARGGEEGLDYATDEDARSFDAPDPLANLFDLGENPLDFVDRQMELSAQLMPKVVDRAVKEGEGYQRARQAFGQLFSEYWRSAIYAARFPGGVHVNRDHKGDANARPPLQVVPAERQRQAMQLIVKRAFAAPSYDADVLSHLAATRWSHWGIQHSSRVDYPIRDFVEMMQSQILSRILSSTTLSRLADNELKVAADADSYTLAEHMRTIVEGVFTEVEKAPKKGKFENRKPYVDGYRRNLQRLVLVRLGDLVTRPGATPDARNLARLHLSVLDKRIEKVLSNDAIELDDYSLAHLMDVQSRIEQVLQSELEVNSVN